MGELGVAAEETRGSIPVKIPESRPIRTDRRREERFMEAGGCRSLNPRNRNLF